MPQAEEPIVWEDPLHWETAKIPKISVESVLNEMIMLHQDV